MLLSKIKKLFKNSKMDELEVQFLNETTFKVFFFRSGRPNAHGVNVYERFDDEYKTFTLDDDGRLPKELFVFLSERFHIPIEELAMHILEN